MAEGRGFEPPVGLLLRLISSQVPLTTQPPFPPFKNSSADHGLKCRTCRDYGSSSKCFGKVKISTSTAHPDGPRPPVNSTLALSVVISLRSRVVLASQSKELGGVGEGQTHSVIPASDLRCASSK